MRAAIIVLAVAALAACAPPTHIEGHKIRATAGAADGLHAGAPAWFEAWWGDYLRHAAGGYAVLALDRNGQGGWYVYCATAGCHILDNPRTRSVKDVHYRYRALTRCREGIEKARPAARPDCALYAIRDRIIWQGPLPWEGVVDPPASHERRAAHGASGDMSAVHMARDMLEFWRMGWTVP